MRAREGYESNKTYEVEIGPTAMNQLGEIKRYISEELLSAQAGARTIASILDVADSLACLPRRRKPLAIDPVTGLEVRSLYAGNYALLYVVEENRVFVVSVLCAASDIDARGGRAWGHRHRDAQRRRGGLGAEALGPMDKEFVIENGPFIEN